MARPPAAAIGLLLLLPSPALAGDGPYDPNLHVDASLKDCSVAFAPNLTQGAYRRFVREFGSVSAFKQASSPATLGPRGVSLELEQIFFSVEEKSAAWNDTFYHPDAYHPLGADKSFPKVRVRVGVADDLEVGAYFTKAPIANYGWLGVDGKYRLLRQREDMPISLAVRGAYTKTLFVTDMNMHALTADVTVGHTFWSVLTPYVGVGADEVIAQETSPAVDLRTEALLVPHAAAGLEVRWWHVALGGEVQLSAITSYQAQVSAVF